ncbi:MAG TPA: YbgF trimerization domain-containing protein, partial [Pedomonas sp.]
MLKCRQVSVALVLAVLTMPLAPLPALAQQDVVKRVDKLEAEMKAVQRQVFPGGASKYFQPEYSDTQPAAPQQQSPGPDLLTELQGRITSLEQQNANLTGQVEEASFRARQAEEALNRFREDVEYRLTVLEGGDPTALKAGAAGAAGAAAGGALG